MNKGIVKLISVIAAISVMAPGFTSVLASESMSVDNGIVVLAEGSGKIGECDFAGAMLSTDGKNRFLQSTEVSYKQVDPIVQLELGGRSDGANGNTGFYIEKTSEYSDTLVAHIGQYVSVGRGPKINFTIPDDMDLTGKSVKTEFMYKPVNGDGNTADLYVYDPANATSGLVTQLIVGTDIIENQWQKIVIETKSDGSTTVYVDDVAVKTASMTPYTFPQIRFTEENSAKDMQSKGYIDNVVLYAEDVTIDSILNGIVLPEDAVEDMGDDLYKVKGDFELPVASNADIVWSLYERDLKDESGNDWHPSENIVTISEGKLLVKQTDDAAKYEYKLVADVTYGEESKSKEFKLRIETPTEAIDKAIEATTIKYKDGTEVEMVDGVYNVATDLDLYKGTDKVSVKWSCETEEGEKSDAVGTDGSINLGAYTGVLILKATYTCGDISKTVDFKVKLPNVIDEYIVPAINELTAKLLDDGTIIEDLNNIGTVKSDIVLPLAVDKINGVALVDGEIAIDWSSKSDNVTIDSKDVVTDENKIKGVVARVLTDDFEANDASIAANVKFVKDGKVIASKETDSYNFKIQFTEDDLNGETAIANADQYKVRFDAALDENFGEIPEKTTSNLSLNEECKFGSDISWKSSDPGVITNSGVVSRKTTDRKVTLTATVKNGTAAIDRTFEVTVLAKASSGGSGGSGGGGGSTSSTGSSGSAGGGGIASNTKPSTDTTIKGEDKVDQLVQEKEEAENRFRDMGDVSWARDAINALADAGIVNGKTDTEFAPNDNVTRAEFAKMLMKTFGLESTSFTTSSFVDVPTDAWYFNSVETAYNLGIINGVGNGAFDPNANITRQDMCVMVVRAAEVSGKSINAVNEQIAFSDSAEIQDYAKDAVVKLQTAGIVNGMSDTVFAPNSNATRAQAAKILYSFL